MKCIICAIAKLENQYLLEWVNYHLALGFSCIHLYDNNEIYGEHIVDVFRNAEYDTKVIVHDVRGLKYIQKKVYQECYDNEEFDWCAFIDLDEFVTFAPDSGLKSINDFLKDKEEWDAVHLNWMCFGDGGSVSNDGRPVLERFCMPKKPMDFCYSYKDIPENSHIKSIIKKGLKIDWNADGISYESNPHTPSGLNRVCNALCESVQNAPFSDIVHEMAFVRHYMTKTIEEYAVKVTRQCADCDAVFYSFPKFFRANRPTFAKLRWLKQHYPRTKAWDCVKEYWKYLIIDYKLPLRFLFRSLSK